MSGNGCAYFIADAHLGQGSLESNRAREQDLLAFFDRVASERAALYVNGDLFDFWFEYAHVIPWRHAPVLAAIRAVVDRGIPVSFLGGNHDWWAGRSFEAFGGMAVHRGPISVQHQGLRLFLAHGDGLASRGDSGYLLLRAVLRHPAAIALLRLVHPDVAYSLGHRLSKFSREHLTDREFAVEAPLARAVDAKLAEGWDAFLMGHMHARHRERRPGGGTLFILGDWMRLFSALRLENGEFLWEDWTSGKPVELGSGEGTAVGGH